MKSEKIILFLSIFLVGALFFGQTAHAEAVYLKNGTVMTGKIVERDEELIVLKNGEGEASVRVTIFLVDVSRIESDEEYGRKIALIPFQLSTSYSNRLRDDLSFLFAPQIKNTSQQHIKELLEENRRLEAMQLPEDLPVVNEEPARQMARTVDIVPFSPIPTEPKKAAGSVCGYVRLPDILNKKRGDLYVYLMQDLGGGKFFAGFHMLFEKINSLDIAIRDVPYKIEHVPEGSYRIFAQWDTAPPLIQKRSVREGETLSYVGFKGDYRGYTEEVITLAEGEKREDVNFYCTTLIKTNEPIVNPENKPNFEIVDLYYRKLALAPAEFIMVVKNNSVTPIDFLAVDVVVNGEKVTQVPMELGFFESKETREFEITAAYDVYKRLMATKDPKAASEKVVRFKILWPSTEEVLFEKALFTL